MSYHRVIPRDLFNEASLLKMLGALWIKTEDYANVEFELELEHENAFDIEQDAADGSIDVSNIAFRVNRKFYRLYRPLNSRDEWPLWLADGYDEVEDFKVFDEHGDLSAEMRALIGMS